MWATCETFEHPELEDGVFLEAVQSDGCTAANWSTLRAQPMAAIQNNIRNLRDFYSIASRNQVDLELIGSQAVHVTTADCGKAKR
ncbi:hypothetical protein [Myxococcus xanthus]|uniref:hypothetical protein n=1 Tax=Myxococcus xanthus TaxID=34 RepID=UPI001F313336|nr:hypothetical protein [Myxococcus xanthus]